MHSVRYDVVRVNCDNVQKETRLVYLVPAVAGGSYVRCRWNKCGVHGHDEMQFTEVFMMTDGLQFVGIVSYVNLVSQRLQ